MTGQRGVNFSAVAVNHLKSGKALSVNDHTEGFGMLLLILLMGFVCHTQIVNVASTC